MSLFSYYVDGYFSGEPSYVMKSKILPLTSNHMKWIFINHVLYKLNFWMYICSGMAKILAPLVNMIKEGCENESALLILLTFFFQAQKSNR